MKTNYDKIKAIIESGHIAQVYDKEYNCYLLYSSIRTNGDIRRSNWLDSIKGCYNLLGCTYDDKDEINSLQNITISVYQRPVWYPKVGDKVQILENVKQSPGYDSWNRELKAMIGGPFEVVEVNADLCSIETKDKSKNFWFDYRHIAPRIEQEEPKQENNDILIKDGKKYRVQILEEIE